MRVRPAQAGRAPWRALAAWSLVAALLAVFAVAPAPGRAIADDGVAAVAAEAPAAAAEARGPWTRLVLAVMEQQRKLHRELAGAIRTLRSEGSPAAAWSLILLSFLYGLFHAAGPGHGKAVIGAYLLTHESAVRRSLLVAAAASLVQGVTAILLVEVLVGLVGLTQRDTQAAVGRLESASFALIALLGAWLTLRALLVLARRLGFAAGRRPALAHAHAHGGQAHDHGHDTVLHDSRGHGHAPDPAALERPLSLRTAAAMVLSIGIRPCSGAVLVLLFAEVLGLRLAGIAAVFAMACGTALAVAVLALLAVNFRRLAGLLLQARGPGPQGALVQGALVLAGNGVALIGGLVILALGASLFLGSLGPSHPLL